MDSTDSHARQGARRALDAADEIREDVKTLWAALGAVERKTAGIARLGRCGLCGEPTRGRYCKSHGELFDDDP